MKYEVNNLKTGEKVSFESDEQTAGTRLNFVLIFKNWNIKDCEIKTKEQTDELSKNSPKLAKEIGECKARDKSDELDSIQKLPSIINSQVINSQVNECDTEVRC